MVGLRMTRGAVGDPVGSPQVQDAPRGRDFTPNNPMNQVRGFSCTTTLRKGLCRSLRDTPVTELGKVQLTATAPPGVLEPHPAAAWLRYSH